MINDDVLTDTLTKETTGPNHHTFSIDIFFWCIALNLLCTPILFIFASMGGRQSKTCVPKKVAIIGGGAAGECLAPWCGGRF